MAKLNLFLLGRNCFGNKIGNTYLYHYWREWFGREHKPLTWKSISGGKSTQQYKKRNMYFMGKWGQLTWIVGWLLNIAMIFNNEYSIQFFQHNFPTQKKKYTDLDVLSVLRTTVTVLHPTTDVSSNSLCAIFYCTSFINKGLYVDNSLIFSMQPLTSC